MPPRERVSSGAPQDLSAAAPTAAPTAAAAEPASIAHHQEQEEPQQAPWARLLPVLGPAADAQTEVEEACFLPLPDSPTHAGGASDQQHQPPSSSPLAKPRPSTHDKRHGPPPPTAAPPGPAPGTAHVHLIGEVTGGCGLGSGHLYCSWQLVCDRQIWSVLRGADKGCTHASSPAAAEDGSLAGVVWETPIDLLLATRSLQHWPCIVLKLVQRSVWLGSDTFVGYALATLPTSPGCHHISAPVWVATEAHANAARELTKLFTGLQPQLVNEAFITDLEKRYEQGQHLHTVGCSSGQSPELLPSCRAMECVSGPGVWPAGAAGQVGALQQRPFCASFSATGSGGTAAAGAASLAAGAAGGGRITLRLHVLTRGLEQLGSWCGGGGASSITACLERLHSNVDKLRRQQQHERTLGTAASSDDDSEHTEESAGVRSVRAGRAGRFASLGLDRAGRGRDQQQDDAQHGSSDGAAAGSRLLSYAGARRFGTSPVGSAAARPGTAGSVVSSLGSRPSTATGRRWGSSAATQPAADKAVQGSGQADKVQQGS